MKRAFMTCFVGFVGLMLPPTRVTSQISAPAKVESEIHALEARRFRAMMEADTRTLDLLLGDDLTYVHSEGWCQTKVEFMAGIRSGDLRYYDVKTEDVMVRVYGKTAVVTGRATVRVKSGSGPKSFKLSFVDVYVKRGSHWQMVAWQSTEVAQPNTVPSPHGPWS
ncbi:MAG: nuclear transport factor 2 family protein [Acidobacteriia bacterium]|nr:nuclear transport factor 2 family protein [Terriglobia bacterium]